MLIHINTYANLPYAPPYAATFLKDSETDSYWFEIINATFGNLVTKPIGPFGDLGTALDAARDWRPEPGKAATL